MIKSRIASSEIVDSDDRDLIDKLDDPYDLYSEDEVVDLKEYIKEYKTQAKKDMFKNGFKFSSPMFSIYRLAPYVILVLGFIGLKNNQLLELFPYMIGLAVGIISGYIVAKRAIR